MWIEHYPQWRNPGTFLLLEVRNSFFLWEIVPFPNFFDSFPGVSVTLQQHSERNDWSHFWSAYLIPLTGYEIKSSEFRIWNWTFFPPLLHACVVLVWLVLRGCPRSLYHATRDKSRLAFSLWEEHVWDLCVQSRSSARATPKHKRIFQFKWFMNLKCMYASTCKSFLNRPSKKVL